MKVVFFTEDFAPSIGGVQTIVMKLARGLVEWRGLLHGNSAEPLDVTVATRTPRGVMDDSALPFRVMREPTVSQLFRLFRKADVIHLAGASIVPMLLGLSLQKPVVVEHHGYQAICPSGNYLHEPEKMICPGHFQNGNYRECFRCGTEGRGRLKSARNLTLLFPRRWLAKRVAANVAVSDHTGRRVALPRTQTIYHGIMETAWRDDERSSRASEPLVLAYVGRLVPDKGVDVLLRAASDVKRAGSRFRLKIIGDGPERTRLEHLGEELQLKDCVMFIGYCEGSSLQKAMADVSVTVMPSLWEEACPMTAIEQMMCGRLVIAAEIGGLSEVVGRTGLKFPPGDAGALAECIKRAVNDRPLVATLGDAARKRALDMFREHQMVEKHIALYTQLAGMNGDGNA
jgi:glycosyltransferase involved in cell wall biosynthesis